MFQWVKQDSSPMPYNLSHQDRPNDVCTNLTQAFQMLREFWVNVWQRPVPPLESLCRGWDTVTSSLHVEEKEWAPLLPADLVKTVAKLSHTSPGRDGWSGSELASFCVDMLRALTCFYNFMEHCQTCPSAWRQICQTHLPKSKGFRVSDHACDCDVSAFFATYKCDFHLLASSRLKQIVVLEWLKTWTPYAMPLCMLVPKA